MKICYNPTVKPLDIIVADSVVVSKCCYGKNITPASKLA